MMNFLQRRNTANDENVGINRNGITKDNSKSNENDGGQVFVVTRQLFKYLGNSSKENLTYNFSPDRNNLKAYGKSGRSRIQRASNSKPLSYKEIRQLLISRAPYAISKIIAYVDSFDAECGLIERGESKRNPFDPEEYIPGTVNNCGEKVQSFLSELESELRTEKFWGDLTEEEWECVEEALERLLMCKIHGRAFQPDEQHIKVDEELCNRIKALGFVTPAHLDIRILEEVHDKSSSKSSLKLAADEINKMNKFKSPKDKVICIVNCCRRITNFLKEALDSGVEGGLYQPGADDILPLLIYVVLKANPENLYSNIEYIGTYRSPKRFTAESRYYFTLLTSAIVWIHQVNHTYLTGISETQFEEALAKQTLCMYETPCQSQEYAQSAINPKVQHPETKIKHSVHQPKKEQDTSEYYLQNECIIPSNWDEFKSWKSVHLQYINKTPQQLRISEVEGLLLEYKYLANLAEKFVDERLRIVPIPENANQNEEA